MKRWMIFIICFLLSSVACSISYTVTSTPIPTNTPLIIQPTQISIPEKYMCRVNTDSLNVRYCGSIDCRSIGIWAIKSNQLTIVAISPDGQWGFVQEFQGWIKLTYCDKIK